MDKKKVAIIGGGIAGLAAAVFLREADSEGRLGITLYESSPKLGGRAYSFYDKDSGQYFDNGQHILAGWYKNTFSYLKAIGSYHKLNFQKSLEVNFIDEDGSILQLKSTKVPPPFNLIFGLLRFKGFDSGDRRRLISLIRISSLKPSGLNALELLRKLNQTENLIKYFWEPFIYAVFNARMENVGDEIFIKVLKTGFLKPGNSNLVIPDVNLNELLVDNAVKYFNKNGIEYHFGKKVKFFETKGDKITNAVLDSGEKISADYFISAVPFFRFSELFKENGVLSKPAGLKASSITSIHIFLEEDIPAGMLRDNSFGMTGLIGKTVQWIFKRSPRHLSLVISGSDYIDDGHGESITVVESKEIYEIAYRDICESLNGFDGLEVAGYKVIKEKRATFIPDSHSSDYRLPVKTHIGNLFIAGDWTDTGYPATIESAVISAKKCADALIENLI